MRADVTPVVVPDLSKFDNSWFSPGRSRFVQAIWFFFGAPLVASPVLPSSAVRRGLLRLFGAHIGSGVVIKPRVRVKYPWLLAVGDHSWIGEGAWIDNLAPVTVGSNACLSQGVYVCTGNHDWSDPRFGLLLGPITIGDGCWVAARSVLCPGVTLHTAGIAAAGSVVTSDIPAGEIHGGNPASLIRVRRGARSAATVAAGNR